MAYNIVASGTTANLINLEELIASVNGNLHKLAYINSNALKSNITLPTAPNIYPHDTVLTAEQIASGVIKHADASNSGLIVNGKFDTDTSGWSALTSVKSAESGKLKITTTDVAGGTFQIIPTVLGKKYIVECVAKNITSTDVRIRVTPSYDYTTTADSNISTTTAESPLKVEFTANGTSMRIYLRVNGINKEAEFDNIAVYPADAISRSDLVFLESDDYVDVSVNDFVYPLGNKQYLGTTGDCGTTVVGSFAGSATYSLFSDVWQADGALVGRGYVWSTLSELNKKLFVSNHENNCYLDGNKVIQVQYRVRVEQGKSDTPLMSQYSFLQDTTKDAGLWYK